MAITVLYPGVEPKTVYCSWTHTVGAAADTKTVGGKVLEVRIYNKLSSGPIDQRAQWSVSTSGSVDTVTVYSNATITAGIIAITYIPR
jgi:hypothetical protein